jgi:hypothetical protein
MGGPERIDAWQRSKDECYRWLGWQPIHQTSLRYRALWEKERATVGTDVYPWGLRQMRAEVDQMLEYVCRQGPTPRKFEPAEKLHPTPWIRDALRSAQPRTARRALLLPRGVQ